VRARGDRGCYTGGDDGGLQPQEAAVLRTQLRAAHASSDGGCDAVLRLVPCPGDGGEVVELVGSAEGTGRRDRRLPLDHTART